MYLYLKSVSITSGFENKCMNLRMANTEHNYNHIIFLFNYLVSPHQSQRLNIANYSFIIVVL